MFFLFLFIFFFSVNFVCPFYFTLVMCNEEFVIHFMPITQSKRRFSYTWQTQLSTAPAVAGWYENALIHKCFESVLALQSSGWVTVQCQCAAVPSCVRLCVCVWTENKTGGNWNRNVRISALIIKWYVSRCLAVCVCLSACLSEAANQCFFF